MKVTYFASWSCWHFTADFEAYWKDWLLIQLDLMLCDLESNALTITALSMYKVSKWPCTMSVVVQFWNHLVFIPNYTSAAKFFHIPVQQKACTIVLSLFFLLIHRPSAALCIHSCRVRAVTIIIKLSIFC